MEKSETDQANSEANDMLEDTRNSLSADESFLMNLKESCAATDKEFEQRQKTRAEEVQAVSKAVQVLSSDDARDTFSSTFNFMQISSNQEEAAKALKNFADAHHNPRLANLAARVRLDAFTKVKKAIDDMVEQLLKEKEDEVKHKDWCDQELRDNERLRNKNSRNTQDSETEIDRLNGSIKQLTSLIDRLNKEVSDLHVDIKRAGEDRQKQNTEFQTVVTEQRETQRLLSSALNVLNSFYAKEKKSFAQEPAGPPPPKGFSSYKDNAQSGGVLNMIQQIIDDALAMEKEAIAGEEESQLAYENMIKESNASVKAKTKERIDAEGDRAQAEEDLAEEKSTLSGLQNTKAQLESEKDATHKACDFVIKNFEVRQDARDDEVAALRNAKAILSGSKFEGFLQRG